jgi:hypothetical protein
MTLEDEFEAAMHNVYREAKARGYTASYFLNMLYERGGVATAKHLVNAATVSDGFTKLWEMQSLDLSAEAVALRPEFRSLFTPTELAAARERLRKYEYEAP